MDGEWLRYASIPVIAGLIGYATNWLAVKMTFAPLEFVGIPPYLGWQGIIPSRARRMASIAVDTTMSKLGTLPEIAREMDPQRIAEHVVAAMRPQVPALVDEIVSREQPELWRNLPTPVRDAVYDRVQAKLPEAVHDLMVDLTDNIEDLLDLRMMVVDLMAADRRLLNRMFLEAGGNEFRFIINSGLYFGFALGLIQMAFMLVFDRWWILPVAGVLVGYVTNWLALNLIFRPVEPRQIGPITLQGLFLRRQAEVAAVFCRLVTQEILTLQNLVERMLTGPRADHTHRLVRKHVRPLIDESVGIAKPAVQMVVGTREYRAIQDELSVRAESLWREPLTDQAFNAERAARVEATMRRRMENLPPREFQNVLRPAFQEDELRLILVGAALGGVAGLLQSIFVFGGIG